MRRSFLKSALALALASQGGWAKIADREPGSNRTDFLALIEEQRASAGLPGLSVGIARRNGIVQIAQSGVRSADGAEPIRADDAFHIGSVTKSMTATMIARLIERGVLGWDTSPADLWPGEQVHPRLATITLEMLLRHRAGFAPMESDEDVATVPVFPGDPRAARGGYALWIMRQPPHSEIGEHVYSNAGYGFAAAMAERAANRSWENLMETELFRPLGMRTAAAGWPGLDQPKGHYYSDGRFSPHDLRDGYQLAPFIAPAGDVHVSTGDMLFYGLAHLRGPEGGAPILSSETWRRLHDAPVGDYALGWNVRGFGIHHLGSAGTFLASHIVSPQRDLVVHIVANGSGFPGSDSMISAIASRAFRDFGPAAQ